MAATAAHGNHHKESFITKLFFILSNGQPIPNITIMNYMILVVKGKMIHDSPAEMYSTFQKILREILRDARNPRAFNGILGREQSIVRREQMHIELAIDQTANVMQNMCGCALWAWNDIEGCVECLCH